MDIYAESMPQVATYWPPKNNNGYGGTTYGAPVQLACRWQHGAALFRSPEGREEVAESVVYTAGAVEVGGKLLEGVSSADVPPITAAEIRQIARSPSLDGSEALHKAFV